MLCMTELGELERHSAEFARRNTRVVVVSVEGPEDASKTQIDFPHLIMVADAGFITRLSPDELLAAIDQHLPTAH
jgi:hypothetical protein